MKGLLLTLRPGGAAVPPPRPGGGRGEPHQGVPPCGLDDPVDVRHDRIPDGHAFDQGAQVPHLLGNEHGEETVPGGRQRVLPDQPQFRFPVGVGKPEP